MRIDPHHLFGALTIRSHSLPGFATAGGYETSSDVHTDTGRVEIGAAAAGVPGKISAAHHKFMEPGALILGGSFHSLGAARSLAKHGIPVWVVDSNDCVSRYSRAVQRFVRCPLFASSVEWVAYLLDLARKDDLDGWVLFPSTDEFVRIVADQWTSLSTCFLLTTPPWEIVRFLYDKRLTRQLAQERGIPTPKTQVPANAEALRSLELQFPVVLKPAMGKHFMAVTRKKALCAKGWDELFRQYERMAAIVDPSEIIIQDLIPGRSKNLYSYVGYFRDGVGVTGMSARRSRQHPMDFGRASTYVESVDVPELEMLSVRLLAGTGYTGLAEVEFMYDEQDGRYELLEVNPRLWGWHTITIRAGIDLPYLAYAEAVGKNYTVGPVREGVKWVRLTSDVPTALFEIVNGRLNLREYLSSMSGDLEFAVLAPRDPLPAFADLLLGIYNYFAGKGF